MARKEKGFEARAGKKEELQIENDNSNPSDLFDNSQFAILVSIQSITPSDPLRGPPPSQREAFGAVIRPIGSLSEGAGMRSMTEGVPQGPTEQLQ